MSQTGVLLLAAGASSRMGANKQLLSWGGQSLLARAADAAMQSGCRPVVAVLGCRARELRSQLVPFAVQILVNEQWERGIGTSIRVGLQQLCAGEPALGSCLIMLADQPLISAGVLRRLLAAHQSSDKPVTICSFDNQIGPPVLVDRRLFGELRCVPDDQGAKSIWLKSPQWLNIYPCPHAALDIDSPRDYQHLVSLTPTM